MSKNNNFIYFPPDPSQAALECAVGLLLTAAGGLFPYFVSQSRLVFTTSFITLLSGITLLNVAYTRYHQAKTPRALTMRGFPLLIVAATVRAIWRRAVGR